MSKFKLSLSDNNDQVNNQNPLNELFELITGQESDLEAIRDLLDNNPELITNESTATDAIGCAIRNNKYSFVEILLDYCRYTELNHLDYDFFSALIDPLDINKTLISIFLNKFPIANTSHQLANRNTADLFNDYKQLIINSDKALGFMLPVLAQIVWEFSTIPYINENFNIVFPIIMLSEADSAVIEPVTIHVIEAEERATVIGNVNFPEYNDADWA